MLKNRFGFIPSSAKTAPSSYRRIFNGWCAIYHHPRTGQEIHVQLVANGSFDTAHAREIEVLKQEKDCRTAVGPPVKTIREAVNIVERLLSA